MIEINFNKTDFLALSESMDEVFPELVIIFFEETELSMRSLKDQIKNKEWSEVRNIAHSLKSSTKTFGAVGLADISFQIERSEQNMDEGHIDKLYQNFVAEYEEVKNLIFQLQSSSI